MPLHLYFTEVKDGVVADARVAVQEQQQRQAEQPIVQS